MEETAEYAIKEDAAEEQAMEHEGTGGGEAEGVPLPLESQHAFPVVRGFGRTFQHILHG
jgi:hypothetical protein